MSAKTESLFHTSHKSFNFAVFCCWGEVVVPSEPPEREKTKKTAKYWTIIKTQPEHCDYWKPELRAHQLNSKYLFCSCFNVVGHFFFSFPFMVEIFVCFPSRTSFPFNVRRYTCWYSLIGFLHILYLNHHIIYLISFSHHIIYLCTFRWVLFFLAVTFFTRTHYTFARLRGKTNA